MIITISICLAVVMQVLDLTIVNVALPYMGGSLHANSDQIAWVLTSYMLANVIVIPLAGLLVERFGQRKIMLWGVAGFTIFSALCGQSHTLVEIVLGRFIQGIFGASLAPVGQSIMIGAYPPEKRGQAMAILGMAITLGPILGPTLGGYLTDTLSWRWVFYVNIPFGILAFLLLKMVPDGGKSSQPRPVDWLGFSLMLLGLGALQAVLSLGEQDDWFGSNTIVILALTSATGLVLFVWRSLVTTYPVVNLRLLWNRDLTIGSLGIGIFGLSFFGAMVILPVMLENLLRYEAFSAGLAMAPQGIASMLSMMWSGRLLGRGFDPRKIVFMGIIFAALGSLPTMSYNLSISPNWVIWPGLIRGIGYGLLAVPLYTLALSTLSKVQQAEGAGIFNLMRTLGGSIGIAAVSTIMAQESQVGWNQIGGHVNRFNPALREYLYAANLKPDSPKTWEIVGNTILTQESSMRGILDAFVFCFWGLLALLPIIIILNGVRSGPPPLT